MNLTAVSGDCLLIAFILYCVAFLAFVIAVTGKRWSKREPAGHQKKWSGIAFTIAVVGLACQIIYFITRWISGNHIPTSNMFEFMTFLGMMISAAFIVVYLIYKTPVLGVIAMPVSFIIIAYASVFPREVEPLIPALKSYWLYIHVTTAATGEAFFAVGFAAGLLYLLRTVSYRDSSKAGRRERRAMELVVYAMFTVIGFILFTFIFRAFGYQVIFEAAKTSSQADTGTKMQVIYTLPAFVAPYHSVLVHMDAFLGWNHPLFQAPYWMKGIHAGRKLNTVIWSVLSGLLLYWLLRLVLRKPLGASIQGIMEGMNPETLDEISYRAIAIGFPIFTLGALIFAMIWASEAWGKFWSWDPKETWALITWLFYALYLHLRLSRVWQGKKAAWLSVIGFIIVMFTLVGVNLIIAGLHSYAGVN